MVKQISGVSIELRQGDIAHQPDYEAVVNAANARLAIGGGVAGAIHRAAGAGLTKETRPLAPIKPGEAVITGAHNLPNKYVIHCLGPVYGRDKPEDELLENCYSNALSLAEEKGISSIAFPAISTGAFGYPLEDAAKVAFSTVIKRIPKLNIVRQIVFVLFSNHDLEAHERVLEEVLRKMNI